MAEWTKDPKETGAYWCKIPGQVPDIIWAKAGKIMRFFPDACYHSPEVFDAKGGMFYGPLDHPPQMPSEVKPVVATSEPEKQVNPTAHEAAVAWAQSQARQFTYTTGVPFGKAVAEVYKACLAEIEAKAVPIGGIFDYFDPRTQVGVNVRQTHANRTGSDGMAGKGL